MAQREAQTTGAALLRLDYSPPAPSPLNRLLKRLTLRRLLLSGGIVGIATLFFCTADLGAVYQTEFSPDTLRFRSANYYFYEFLPSPSNEEWSSPFLDMLRSYEGQSAVPPADPPRWHFVHGQRAFIRGWHGPAKAVYRMRDSDYRQWSADHPEAAAVLWPEVVRLLREERYTEVQYLMLSLGPRATEQDVKARLTELGPRGGSQ